MRHSFLAFVFEPLLCWLGWHDWVWLPRRRERLCLGCCRIEAEKHPPSKGPFR